MSTITDADLSVLRGCKAFLVDLDGTIYLDNKLLPGALDFLVQLERLNIPHLFLTNNSSKSWTDYRDRLAGLGITATREQILTSGDATIDHVLTHTEHRSAFLMGTEALAKDFRLAGVDLDAEDPDCVVVGFDTTMDYEKLERACTLLFAGKPYFATHPDRTCITQRGLVPDIAAIIAAIEAVTRREPKIIGKPFPEMVAAALHVLGADAHTTAMVGDQLDTDMEMALNSELRSVLLMSGETSPEKLAAAAADRRPDIVLPGISALAKALEQL